MMVKMAKKLNRKEKVSASKAYYRIALACAAGTMILCGVVLGGWVWDLHFFVGRHPEYIPMAPSTALAFVLLNVALLIFIIIPQSRLGGYFARGASFLVSLFGLLIIIQFLLGLDFHLEQRLFPVAETLGLIPLGRMSPITAANFVLIGSALFLLFTASEKYQFGSKRAAAILATTVVAMGLMLTLGYSYGAPFFYGENIIPVALSTAAAFSLLGMGLVVALGPEFWPLSSLVGSSVQARLLRAFLPTVLIIILAEDWFIAVVSRKLNINPALISTWVAILLVLVLTFIISRIAHVIGGDIERTEMERRHAEEILRQSEERFRAVAQTANDAIISADSNGIIIFWNQGAKKIFGYEEAEILGRPVTLLMPERYRNFHTHGLERMRTAGEARMLGKTLELEGLRKDGREFPLELALATWKIREETFYTGILRDITERRRVVESLRESEERYRLLFESNPQPMYVYDLETLGFLAVNDAAVRQYGYSHDEFKSMKLTDLRLPEDVPQLLAKIPTIPASVVTSGPLRHRKKDGTVIYVETISYGIFFASRPGRLVLAKDVTEQKRLEEQLRKLSHAVEQSPSIIIITDVKGNIEYVNPKFTQVTGYAFEEVRGQNSRFLKSSQTPPEEYKNLWDTITNGGEWRGEFHNKKKNGELYWEFASISPITNQAGITTHFLAVKEDITERKRLEEQLRQSQKMEAVGTLAGGVAHDFNNLLTAILGNLELVKLKAMKGEPVETPLEEIAHVTNRAALLTQQLLAFSRRQILQPVPLNLNDSVYNMNNILPRLLGEHIELELRLEGKLCLVKADPTQMEQVIMNLCINARDAMPKGGKLIIKTQNTVLDDSYTKSHPWVQRGGYVLLEVDDSGCGMDKSTLERIFEPFFTTKEPGKGTGLGLSMVYGIVKQHQGYINVYSEPGQGSSFKIYLPCLREALVVEAIKEEAPRSVAGKETILLAEDEEYLRETIRQILEMYGYTVLTAKDGKEAVDLYEQQKDQIDLVILDAVMPQMGGMEAAGFINAINPSQKILFSSGYSAEGIHRTFTIGTDLHFIQKPYTAQALAQKVREVLEKDEG